MAKKTNKNVIPLSMCAGQVSRINARHSLGLTTEDVQCYEGEVYVSTTKAAEFMRASFNIFSNQYVPAITGKKHGSYQWVRRMILGRSRWYAFSDLEKLLELSVKENKSVFEICKAKPK